MLTGTTITKATAASLSERTRAGNRKELTGARNWLEVPRSPCRMPVTQLQYWVISGRSTPRVWFSACTARQGRPNETGGRGQGGFLTAAEVLVTGAASGIGLAVAARCLAEGAAVAALDRDGAALSRAVGALPAGGRDRAIAVQADVADP